MLLAEVLSGYKGQPNLLISTLLLLPYAAAGRNEYLPQPPEVKVLHLAGFFIPHHIRFSFSFLQDASLYFKA